jgi:hypothetical protein
VSPRYHISKDDLRRLREELSAARNLHTDKVGSVRLMERLIRMASQRRH